MPTQSYLLLWTTVVASGMSLFFVKKLNPSFLKLLLSFSASFLFAISVLHLLPKVYASADKYIGVYVFAGFFLQIILEFFSEGIEHGHIHVHKSSHQAFPFAMMIGLCIHSFLEGMPLVQKFPDASTQNSLLTGIILHHIPVALALMSMVLASGTSKRSAVLILIIFASMAPLGALTTQFISDNSLGSLSGLFDKMMAVVIGIFLHISTTILFESYEEHRFNYYKLLIIVLGAGIAFLTF